MRTFHITLPETRQNEVSFDGFIGITKGSGMISCKLGYYTKYVLVWVGKMHWRGLPHK